MGLWCSPKIKLIIREVDSLHFLVRATEVVADRYKRQRDEMMKKCSQSSMNVGTSPAKRRKRSPSVYVPRYLKDSRFDMQYQHWIKREWMEVSADNETVTIKYPNTTTTFVVTKRLLRSPNPGLACDGFCTAHEYRSCAHGWAACRAWNIPMHELMDPRCTAS